MLIVFLAASRTCVCKTCEEKFSYPAFHWGFHLAEMGTMGYLNLWSLEYSQLCALEIQSTDLSSVGDLVM